MNLRDADTGKILWQVSAFFGSAFILCTVAEPEPHHLVGAGAVT
jgi:hypothetical protein